VTFVAAKRQMTESYTAAAIAAQVEQHQTRLFSSYSIGRPANWSCDTRTRNLVCIGNWLQEEMLRLGLDDLGRRTMLGEYNRCSRSEDDLFSLAARIMEDIVNDRIDRNRRPHRRWG